MARWRETVRSCSSTASDSAPEVVASSAAATAGSSPPEGGQQDQPQLVVGVPVVGFAGRRARAEQNVLVGAEQQHGTRGRSAREIADVGGAGDQDGRGSDGGAPVAEEPAPDGVHL
ncbi:hypothetical protein GCM10018966_038690 [Streptomyces yanii]